MAVPTSFAESNAVLDKPPSMSYDECAAISIMRGSVGLGGTENRMPVVMTCWKLTQEELDDINRTGRIWVLVCGETMPPMCVEGMKPEIRGDDENESA